MNFLSQLLVVGGWQGGKIQFTGKIYPPSCSKRDLIKSPALDFTQPDIELKQAGELKLGKSNNLSNWCQAKTFSVGNMQQKKHGKNLQYCPVSLSIVRQLWLSWIGVLICIEYQHFHKSSQDMSWLCCGHVVVMSNNMNSLGNFVDRPTPAVGLSEDEDDNESGSAT